MAVNSVIQPPPNFAATFESILEDAEKLVEHSRQRQDDVVRAVTPVTATYANVMEPLASIDNNFALESNILCFYQHVSEDEQIREASRKSQKLFDMFRTESFMREDIFALVSAVHDRREDLDTESCLLLKLTYDKYIQLGVGLHDTNQKRRYEEIQARLREIKIAFREGLANDGSTIDFSFDELRGVPDRILAKLETNGATYNQYRVALSNSSHMEIMEHATKSETRRRLFIASQNRCAGNGPLLKEAAILRYESANLLGFPNNAARQIHGRMAKVPESVNKFLAGFCSKIRPAALASLNALQNIKTDDVSRRDERDQHDHDFFIWDYHFYHRVMLDQHLAIDHQKIREYFPLQTTITGMISIFASLFELTFVELIGADKSPNIVWHQDTKIFRVHDMQRCSNRFLGYLFLDLFHRRSKYPNSACFNLQPGFTQQDGSRYCPSVALLCDFPQPTSTKPCLLGHFEMVTMFHELGHCMHDLLSETRYARFHGPDSIPVDFGELPSQMLEQWCWIPSQLKKLSMHYSYVNSDMLEHWRQEHKDVSQPQKHMPDSVIDSLIRARSFTFGPLFYLDQLQRSFFDMAINQVSSLEEAKSLDLATIWNRLHKDIRLISGPEELGLGYSWGHGYATFSHLISADYDAGYYSYLFSQVFAVDLFYTKFNDDHENSEMAQKYRRCILKRGGSQDHMQALIDFLDRPPSAEAFIEHLFGFSTR